MKITMPWMSALIGAMLISPASAGNISPDALGYGAIGSGNQTPSFGSMCAGSDNVYCNTPGINGQVHAWTINFGFAVADSFTVSPGTVTGADFAVWLFPGDQVNQVSWCISTAVDFCGSSTIASGTSAVGLGRDDECGGGSCDFGTNRYDYDIQSLEFSFGSGGVNLAAGTYYLTLQNATSQLSDPVYWDQNDGPSLAYNNFLGPLPSEAFAIDGSATVPEPGTLALGGSGLLLLVGALRRMNRK